MLQPTIFQFNSIKKGGLPSFLKMKDVIEFKSQKK